MSTDHQEKGSKNGGRGHYHVLVVGTGGGMGKRQGREEEEQFRGRLVSRLTKKHGDG